MKTNFFYAVILGLAFFWLNSHFLDLTDTSKDISPYYEKLSVDYIIPSPGHNQKEELEKEPFIDKATPYYSVRVPISQNGKDTEVSLYIIEKNVDINKTPFSKDLLISGELPEENEIIIDYRTSQEAHISVGDKLKILFETSTITFRVSGIVYTNILISEYLPSSALIYCTPKVKKALDALTGNQLSYQGAYLKVNDTARAREYLKTYIAKGEYGKRSWYESNAAYENKKKSIENTVFFDEITDVNDLKASAVSADKEKKNHNRRNIRNAIASSVIAYILAWMIFLKLKEKGYQKLINNGKSVILVVMEFALAQFLCFVLVNSLTVLLYYNKFQENVIYLLAVNTVSFALVLIQTFTSVTKTDVSILKRDDSVAKADVSMQQKDGVETKADDIYLQEKADAAKKTEDLSSMERK